MRSFYVLAIWVCNFLRKILAQKLLINVGEIDTRKFRGEQDKPKGQLRLLIQPLLQFQASEFGDLCIDQQDSS
jgi:hypothetical protein